MNDELSVVDGDRVVAHLTRLRGGDLRLTYSDSYRAIAHPTPLSVSLPVSTTTHRGPRLSNWLWGLLPDNEAVLRTWARTFSVSLASPFGLLSTPIGRDCAGAFSFVRDPIDVERNDGATDWLTEAQVAAALRGLRADSTSWLGSDPPGRFSLAGCNQRVHSSGTAIDGAARVEQPPLPTFSSRQFLASMIMTSTSTYAFGRLMQPGSLSSTPPLSRLRNSPPSSFSDTTECMPTGSRFASIRKTCARHTPCIPE